jgi:preprotein translocase subunit SecD
LAIVLDGKVISAPIIEGKIPNGKIEIHGNFTISEAYDLVGLIRSGFFPIPMKVIDVRPVNDE